ncbi:MAG: hypothetical protein ACXWCV_13080 [Caldimonas sp.]
MTTPCPPRPCIRICNINPLLGVCLVKLSSLGTRREPGLSHVNRFARVYPAQ